jgi:hypothetical protein
MGLPHNPISPLKLKDDSFVLILYIKILDMRGRGWNVMPLLLSTP